MAGFNHALRVMALWLEFQQELPADGWCCPPGLSGTGMRKSNLLGRLMRGEEIRRRPCPEHRGRLVSAPWERDGLACGCGGTGWLPNAPGEGGAGDRPRGGPWWRPREGGRPVAPGGGPAAEPGVAPERNEHNR